MSFHINYINTSSFELTFDSTSPKTQPTEFVLNNWVKMLSTELIGITDLVAVNLQCFGFIFLGYLSRRSNLIGPEEVKGLNIFVSYFALPAMIFQSLATLPLSNIDYNFVGSILISKSIIFIIVLLFTFQLSYKSCTKYFNIRRSSMFAMFCTQSNDFALGYPLLQSLYGTSKSSLANYLYILAPIQLLILNPIALLLIEVGKNLESPDTRTEHTTRLRRFSNILQIIFQKIFINPIILATFFGILINLLNHQSLPQVVLPFFTVLSQSFSSVALFLLGLNIYGNFKLLNNFSQPLLVTLVLTSIKIFFMPLLNRFLVQHVTIFSNEGQNSTFSEFSFLYGTFPAAPTVYIFSNLYDIETIIISTGLVISTLFSAPLMFVSANMIRLSSTIDYKQLNADLIDTMFYISIASIVGTVLLIFSFFNRYRLRSLTHRYTFKILLSHILVIIGAFLFKFESTKQPQPLSWENKIAIIQYILFHVGLFSLKIWTCFLSFTLVLLYARSLCYTVQILTRFLYTGIFILICYLVMLGVTFMTTIDQTSSSAIDLYYGTNKIHLSISIFSSCFTLISLSISLVFFHRYKNSSQYEIITGTNSSSGLSENENDSNNPIASTSVEIVHDPSPLVEVEDLFLALPRNRLKEEFKDRCGETCHSSCSARKVCTDRFENYKSNIESAIEAVDMSHLFQDDQSLHKDFHQVYHHLYLLLFLALSIIVHLVVEICHLVEDEPTGIYIEIEFLDILLTFSQGFIIFVIFGFDIDHIVQKLSKIFHLSLRLNQIYLPPIRSLNPDTIILCEQFRKFHLKSCKDDVTFTLENDVYFCGKRLIDWLLRKQFVSTREEGIDYGRKLLYGRVIEHITREHFFCDNTFYYRFIE